MLINNCGFCGAPIFEHEDFCSKYCEKRYRRGGENETDKAFVTAGNAILNATNGKSIEGKVMAVNHDKGTIRIVVEVPARVKIGESVMVTFKHGQLHRVVRYIGATDDQVRFGGCDDPRGLLVEGGLYGIANEEVHTWHTKYKLSGFGEKRFNSASFEFYEPSSKT